MKNKVTIYACHGWTYNISNWQTVIDILKKENIELIFFKIPGLTQTSSKVFTINDYTNWLLEELKNINSPVMLGHSNGGRILLNFCLKHPDKIKKLILVNSAGIYPHFIYRLRIKTITILAKIFKPLSKIKLIKKIVYRILKVSDYKEANPNMKQTLKNMLDSDKNLTHNLTNIKTNTHLIWGNLDKVTRLRDAKILNNLLANSYKLNIINNAGHIPYVSHPQELADLIVKIVNNKF